MSKPALLNTGPMMPLIEEGIARDFRGAPPARGGRRGGAPAQDRAGCPRHLHRQPHGREDRRGDDGPLPRPQDHRQLRRRLRHHRRGRCGQARHRHHQHARRAHRGGGGHDAGAAARHRARVLRCREMAARRALAQGGRIPSHGLLARSQRRHRRLRPHRQSHRAQARGVRPPGELLRAQTAARRQQPLLQRPRRHGARCRHADPRDTRRPRHCQSRQCRGARARSGRAAS